MIFGKGGCPAAARILSITNVVGALKYPKVPCPLGMSMKTSFRLKVNFT